VPEAAVPTPRDAIWKLFPVAVALALLAVAALPEQDEEVAALPEQADAVVAVAALPVVFWFQVGTVPVSPEYATLVAVAALPLQELDVVALPVNAAVTVPAVKLPDASRATIVDPVLAEVAFDATVNVAAVPWFAVNVCEPDRPVPDTLRVNVPSLAGVTTPQEVFTPSVVRNLPEAAP
jgi:hypothetical protein